MNPFDWYQNEQQKRQDRRNANDVSLINRNLQQLLYRIEDKIDKEKYKEAVYRASHHLERCSIWRITYLNNMENAQVALAQGLFIAYILENEDELEDRRFFENEVDIQMRRLGNVDWSLFLQYGESKGRLIR